VQWMCIKTALHVKNQLSLFAMIAISTQPKKFILIVLSKKHP